VNKLIINAMMILLVSSSAMSCAKTWNDVWSALPPKAQNVLTGAWHAGKYSAGIGIVAAASMIALSGKENLNIKLQDSALCVAFWTVPSVFVGSGIGLFCDQENTRKLARVVGCLFGTGSAITATGYSTAAFFLDTFGVIEYYKHYKR